MPDDTREILVIRFHRILVFALLHVKSVSQRPLTFSHNRADIIEIFYLLKDLRWHKSDLIKLGVKMISKKITAYNDEAEWITKELFKKFKEDILGEMIVDLHRMFAGEGENMTFLRHLE